MVSFHGFIYSQIFILPFRSLYGVKVKRYPASLVLAAFLVVVVASSSFVAGSAYGHGLGVDQSLPVTIGNRQVAVEASLEPTSIDQISNRSSTLLVRAFDPGSNATISGVVDYRIAVELQGETLLDQRFRSSDGIVLANLVPDESIDSWEIAGRESAAAPDEQVPVSQSTPVQLRSRMLTDGGLYHIAVTIESSSTGIQVGQDKRFDLYVSIARSFNFETDGGQEMSVITYYDEVTDFSYKNTTISFKMPFTWDQAYIDQVPVLHMEVRFPKSIEELQTNSYTGTLNGQNLGAESIQIDDYTSEQDRIVHFVIANTRLSRVAESVGDNSSAAAAAAAAAAAVFTLKPAEKPKFPLDLVTSPGENYILQLSWGPDVIETGAPVTFVMNIQDPTTGDLIRHSSFDFVLTQGGQEIHRQQLTSDLGTYSHQYAFTRPGTVTLSASNINGANESAKIDLAVLQGTGELPVQQPPPPNQQPSGCLIATAAFGSELTPQVQYLRDFRDNYIMSTASGSAFMNAFNSVYYSFSPQVADYEREQPWLQATVKAGLYPLFGILMASESAYSAVGGEAGAALAGAIASSLIGAVYLAPAGAAAAVASRRGVDSKILLIIVGAAAAILTIALVFMPALLPISTSAFVIAAAGSSAIMVAKAVRHAACRLKQQLRKL